MAKVQSPLYDFDIRGLERSSENLAEYGNGLAKYLEDLRYETAKVKRETAIFEMEMEMERMRRAAEDAQRNGKSFIQSSL